MCYGAWFAWYASVLFTRFSLSVVWFFPVQTAGTLCCLSHRSRTVGGAPKRFILCNQSSVPGSARPAIKAEWNTNTPQIQYGANQRLSAAAAVEVPWKILFGVLRAFFYLFLTHLNKTLTPKLVTFLAPKTELPTAKSWAGGSTRPLL